MSPKKESWEWLRWFEGFFIALTLMVATAATIPKPEPEIVKVPVKVEVIKEVVKYVPVKIDANDQAQIRCLAENAYYEARGQGRAGQLAVTNVVMNRVEDRRFPNTACGVVKQKARGVCQFSWVCSGKNRIVDQATFRKTKVVAEDVYINNVGDNTGGAKFFHAKYVKPSWARVFKVTKIIGDHIFYKG